MYIIYIIYIYWLSISDRMPHMFTHIIYTCIYPYIQMDHIHIHTF